MIARRTLLLSMLASAATPLPALALAAEARALGFDLMVGCMVATSLAMAPAMLAAQRARVVDLDGPLLLAKDRPDGLRYHGSLVYPPTPALWG